MPTSSRVVSKEFISSDDDDDDESGTAATGSTGVVAWGDSSELDEPTPDNGSSSDRRSASPTVQANRQNNEAPQNHVEALADRILLQSQPKKKKKKTTKRGGKAAGASDNRNSARKTVQETDKQEAQDNNKTATYSISIFKASEKEKDLKKRIGSNTFMKLSLGEPFDTWKAQLLTRIDKCIQPAKLNIDDYNLLFTVPRTSPAPMGITSEEDYIYMVERVMKNKDLACTIYVQALKRTEGASKKREKENDGEDENGLEIENGHTAKKAKKTKAPRSSDISTANIPHNDNIKALRERWLCHKKPGCPSEHCFINPVDATHFVLSHSHFDAWGAAMLKGPDIASLTKPPHHHLFSAISGQQLGQLSPLIERQNRAKNANNSGPSTMQLSLSPEIIQLFRPPSAVAPPPQTPPAALPTAPAPVPVTQPIANDEEASLIPAERLPGPEMTLEQFCEAYRLTDRVRIKLDECGYSGTHTFPYSKWMDLTGEAGLKGGEIAQLKHAISKWTVPR